MSEGSRPGLRGFARVGMVAVWVVFWLNTALFPCCEVAAAVLGGHADDRSQTAPAAPPSHHSEATHSEPLDHSPVSPCGDSLTSGPALVGDYEGLKPARSPLECFAVDAPVTKNLTAINHPANLALARAAPLPSLRLYQRTQRLLV